MGTFKIKECLVIRYNVSFLGITNPEWCRVTAHATDKYLSRTHEARYHELTREQAKRLIKELGLVLVEKNKHGEIYGTPDRSFQAKYLNTISIPWI